MIPAVEGSLRAELSGDEGERLRVYDDKTGKPIGPGSVVVGNPTIGKGRNLFSRGITRGESEYLFSNDLVSLAADLDPLLPWVRNLSPNRQCAVYSLYFNTALGNPHHFVGSGWPVFLGQMQRGEFEAAADNLLTSQPWATEVGPRAPRLANLVRIG